MHNENRDSRKSARIYTVVFLAALAIIIAFSVYLAVDNNAFSRASSSAASSVVTTGSGSFTFGDPVSDVGYIGNVETHKFHTPSCSYLPSEDNQVVFDTRFKAVAAGYEPCGHCNP